MIQAQFMYDFDGRAPFDEPSGRQARGWGPYYHCYRAADGWLFFAAPTEKDAALARVPELTDLAGHCEEGLVEELADRFSQYPIAHWQQRFRSGSAGVVPLGSLSSNREASLQRESDGPADIRCATYRAIRHDQHPMGRWVDLVAPNAVRPAKAAITIPSHAPKPGADTRAVLSNFGYREEEIAAMIESSTAGEGWSDKYLPE
jgi:crotonobetainyl-CoA:carnitine CoA-transferase CaiB-like acyl-CoA transferase